MKMSRTGGYRWSGVRYTPRFKTNLSVVCSGSRVTNSTVMKLHESDNRDGIIVKTYAKSTCSHYNAKRASFRSKHLFQSTDDTQRNINETVN